MLRMPSPIKTRLTHLGRGRNGRARLYIAAVVICCLLWLTAMPTRRHRGDGGTSATTAAASPTGVPAEHHSASDSGSSVPKQRGGVHSEFHALEEGGAGHGEPSIHDALGAAAGADPSKRRILRDEYRKMMITLKHKTDGGRRADSKSGAAAAHGVESQEDQRRREIIEGRRLARDKLRELQDKDAAAAHDEDALERQKALRLRILDHGISPQERERLEKLTGTKLPDTPEFHHRAHRHGDAVNEERREKLRALRESERKEALLAGAGGPVRAVHTLEEFAAQRKVAEHDQEYLKKLRGAKRSPAEHHHQRPHRQPAEGGEKPVPGDATPEQGYDGNSTHLSLALFTTLKPCINPRIRDAQISAVMSWAALPLEPHPIVAIMGSDPCAIQILHVVDKTLGPGRVHIVRDAKLGPHGTLLLGAAVQQMRALFPYAHVYGLINADIILDPACAAALRAARNFFISFFLIGHRLSVDFLGNEDGKKPTHAGHLPDFAKAGWERAEPFASARKDRQDAEDYFLWSSNFFTDAAVEIPNFHVGRPAYDNWLVHAALHTFQPVIDATELFIAYHQKHDYAHLKKEAGKDGSYWGGDEQKENYDLGIAHGGWQHGLIEFAPWGFAPAGCHNRLKELVGSDGRTVADIQVTDDEPCALRIKSDWKPLSEGQFGDLDKWIERYRHFVTPGKRLLYDKRCSEDVKQRQNSQNDEVQQQP